MHTHSLDRWTHSHAFLGSKDVLFRDNEGNTLGAEIARRALPAPNGQQPH
jgi:hypothetical protein